MQPSHWRVMTQSERPSLSIMDETAVPNGRTAAHAQAVDVRMPLLPANAELHHQIADALTAIMLQAESVRRNSTNSQVNEAAVTSSCEHIIECAKRAWQLIVDRPDATGTRR